MKGNSKKLAVFVMIAAIAMFTAVAMALADDHQWKHGIQGDYAVTGTNTCLVAPTGFTSTFMPSTTGLWVIFQGYIEGIYTFHPDGTGSFTSTVHGTMQAGPAAGGGVSASESSWGYDFTYTVTDDGVITFKVVPCAGGPGLNPASAPTYNNDGPHDGVISPDGENLNVTCGVPGLLKACTACTGVGEPSDTLKTCAPSSTELACNISMSGFKIPKPFKLPE